MKLENYDKFPTELTILKQDNIIYPFMIVPIFLDSKEDIEAAKEAYNSSKLLFITTNPKENEVGTVGTILREVSLPNGKVKILFQGMAKGTIKEITSKEPLKGIIELNKSQKVDKLKADALIDTLKEHT